MAASLALAFALQVYTLHRIDRTMDSMEDSDEEMQLILELETAVQEQYALEEKLVATDGARLSEHERARDRTAALASRLGELAEVPEPSRTSAVIRDLAVELNQVFVEKVLPAVKSRAASPELVRQVCHPIAERIQREIDVRQRQLEAAIVASRDGLRSLEDASIRWLAGVLLVSAAVFAGAVRYLSRSVARPLALLTKEAAVLGKGDLGARIHIDTPDEFGSLATDINAMATSIEEKEGRLVESEKLAGIGRIAAGIAEEITSPLQAMLGHLSHSRGVRHHLLAAVEKETLRCKQIVDGMLELSRPATPLDLHLVDLRVLSEEVSESLWPLARPAKVRIIVHGGGSAFADRCKLRQAVYNLVKNAVEAAGYGGQVDVRVLESASGPHIRVSDTGPGIPPELRQRLFEPLFSTKESGTGLGLAVSRAIVRAHGGDIDVRDGAEGGATFLLQLPRALN